MLFAAAVISIASAYTQHGNGSMPQSLLFSPDSFKLGTPYPGNGPNPATIVAPPLTTKPTRSNSHCRENGDDLESV
jgi:hypothetical protein